MATRKRNSSLRNKKAVLSKINYNVAGIDLSSEDMFIVVIEKNVRRFTTFTNGSKMRQFIWNLKSLKN